MMLRASKIAFMPALALHSAMPSPRRKPKVSLPSLFAAMRVISSRRMSSAPPGTMSAATERCLLIVAASENSA
jgi:hypothetical protein